MSPPLAAAPFQYVLLGGAALAAGAMNAMAGGGSFLTFPALLGVHVPPVNANATNTVALWPGQLASIFGFRADLAAIRHLLIWTGISSALGGVAGAVALLSTDQKTFMRLVPFLLLFATLLFAASGPVNRWLRRFRAGHGETPAARTSLSPLALLLLTAVTFYIGYFGAGAGFLVITLFSLLGLTSLNEINALKVVCTSIANGVAVITFIVAGAVYWRDCLIMLLFAVAGGFLGATYSRKLSPAILRSLIIVIGLVLSVYYFLR